MCFDQLTIRYRMNSAMFVAVLSFMCFCGCNDLCEDSFDCDDGDACTIDDCRIGGILDGNICAHIPLDCEDCDSETGCPECEDSEDCDDGDPCTTDSCSSEGACNNFLETSCVSLPVTCTSCDDGDPCTTDDSCEQLQCVGTPIDCPDGESCADGECVVDDDDDQMEGQAGLLGAAGVYVGTAECGDEDNTVELVENGGSLALSGYISNGDIALTLLNDKQASATQPSGDILLTLIEETGDIAFIAPIEGGLCDPVLTKSTNAQTRASTHDRMASKKQRKFSEIHLTLAKSGLYFL